MASYLFSCARCELLYRLEYNVGMTLDDAEDWGLQSDHLEIHDKFQGRG
jgi:hypothetical protein